MNWKRIVGAFVVLIGIALVCVAYYIKQQVAAGEALLSQGEKRVKQADALFSLTPVTKEVGDGLTSSGKQQIAMGKEQIAYYTSLAQWLQIGGIVVIVIGAAVVVFGKTKPRRKSR